jgi:hypothetical protein
VLHSPRLTMKVTRAAWRMTSDSTANFLATATMAIL